MQTAAASSMLRSATLLPSAVASASVISHPAAVAAAARYGGLAARTGLATAALRPTLSQAPVRHASLQSRRQTIPLNTGINFVPQQEAWVVERFGKFHSVLEPGLNLLVPIVDQIRYVHSLKELALDIPSQSAITQDNVTLNLDGVLYLSIVDPKKASYGVENPEYAVKQLAQTTMRSEIGMMKLDDVFKERASLNARIVEAINSASNVWGITCLRYEIRDIQLPERVIESMQMQVAAERKKRAAILESEGQREAAINIAEGHKQSMILSSEAQRLKQINEATGQAQAIESIAKATAQSLTEVGAAMARQGGAEAMSFSVAQQYMEAFSKIAKAGNTILLPANATDPASMVSQALAVFKGIQGVVPSAPSALSDVATRAQPAAPARERAITTTTTSTDTTKSD
ncbi:stomatin-like protein 2 [Capsaspora owczarzaki ATCC 30864]|uniref:Stomatin-like protein 2 n=1 Tax=Capsaspora owczarzaki (strain ATCC 30864) TaxID=595528 RepID=A0A0D2WPU8_CAPO3|nr:stomatin-like protein 2 [Capsaspora owczarzaki ATCC 30864]KJE92798.1 stomatin-like protein 2 [Capsaspora owczarzaki ATCC 30864]|eukprot:XP_004363426.1 stomatin-like protein 2 [Capsaspora owczarzaki ATCC 30864]